MVILNACVNLPGPVVKLYIFSVFLNNFIRLIPSIGSIDRIKTAPANLIVIPCYDIETVMIPINKVNVKSSYFSKH